MNIARKLRTWFPGAVYHIMHRGVRRRAIFQEEMDYQVLLKIVEAEAGSEDLNGRILVANVVLNRVKSELFPDCVTDVVYQHSNGVYQFSPVKNGTIDTVSISEETKQAVELALDGTDLSKGALYFAARNAANEKNMRWFDTHLVRLFAHGGHEFFG
mgnify:CR=1 FL=1